MSGTKLTHHYRAYHGWRAKCDLEIVRHPDFVLVIASERDDNPGRSVTNWAAELATEVCRVYDIPPQSLVWVEHYPDHPMDPEHWDLTRFQRLSGRAALPNSLSQQQVPTDGMNGQFTRPKWIRLNDDQLQALRSGSWPELPDGTSALSLQETAGDSQ